MTEEEYNKYLKEIMKKFWEEQMRDYPEIYGLKKNERRD